MPALGHHHISWYNRELCARAGDEWRGSPTAIMSEGVWSRHERGCAGARRTGQPTATTTDCVSVCLSLLPPTCYLNSFVCLFVCSRGPSRSSCRPSTTSTTHNPVSQPTYIFAFAQYLNYDSEISKKVFRSYCQDFMYKLYDSYLIPKALLDIQISDEGLKQITHRLNTETFTLFTWKRNTRCLLPKILRIQQL